MAFLGRINSQGTMVSRELFCGRAVQVQPRQDDIEAIEGSRTYIKTYDNESLLRAMASPSTVRYGGGSGSSSEVNSLDETECSTLRRCSLVVVEEEECEEDHELDTGSETLCLRLGSPGSSSSSRSGSSRESDAKDKSSTTSMCSWEEAMSRGDSLLPPSSQGEDPNYSMPSLHLGSDRVSPPLTYTRRLDPLRLERSAGEAYENWLSGKRQQAQYQRQAERRSREEQLQRAELRQRLSQERYEQWCRQKAQQSSTANSRQAQPARIPPRKSYPATTSNSRLQQWELEKLRLAEQQRLRLQGAERRRQQEKLQRQQQAEHAFQRWMSHVDQRPKPVPSSQGLKSLRGTISDIYINPNRWID